MEEGLRDLVEFVAPAWQFKVAALHALI